MASKSIDWDEVLVTKKPKQKEIEVSFKKVDGDGFLTSFGSTEPGTPAGTEEDENGCKNRLSLVSDDTWMLRNNEPHWVWIKLNTIPTEEYTVTLTFTDGTLLRASGHYNYTTQDVLISPGAWEANEQGVTGIKWPLALGDVSDLTDVGVDAANYNVAITAVDGIAVECWDGAQVSLDFAPVATEVPPEEEASSGEPVPPVEPPVECQTGNDCASRFNRAELSGAVYDSIYHLREGFAESTDTNSITYFPQTDPINGTTRASNCFELRDESLNVIFDGNADSTSPDLLGNESQFQFMNGAVLADSVIKYNKAASPITTGQAGYDNNAFSMDRFSWEGKLANDCAGQFFCAPSSQMIFGTRRLNRRRSGTVGTHWPIACEVTDPTNISADDRWVSAGGTAGAEESFTTWESIFLTEPYIQGPDGYNIPLNTQKDPLTDGTWPTLRLTYNAPEYGYVHDGLFGGNRFTNTTYSGGAELSIDGPGNIEYLGSFGNGGGTFYQSPFAAIPNRNLSGWWTVKYEVYQSVAYKPTNNSGDFGFYDFGVTTLQQRWSTWFYNGQQVTPRTLMSQFTRPTDYDTTIPPTEQTETVNFGENNKYFRDGLPLDFASIVRATYITKPISYSSRWQPGFGGEGETSINIFCNQGDFTRLNGLDVSEYVAVGAQVDHSEAGLGFFKSDQFKSMIRTFDNNNPDYCNRIP